MNLYSAQGGTRQQVVHRFEPDCEERCRRPSEGNVARTSIYVATLKLSAANIYRWIKYPIQRYATAGFLSSNTDTHSRISCKHRDYNWRLASAAAASGVGVWIAKAYALSLCHGLLCDVSA